MQKVLKKGISLVKITNINSQKLSKYELYKIGINIMRDKNTVSHNQQIYNSKLSYKYSSIPNSNWNGSFNKNNNFNRNQGENNIFSSDSFNSQKQQAAPNYMSSGKLFYSHTKMSNHYVIKEEEIKEFLSRFNLPYKLNTSQTQIMIEFCPFCNKPHNNDITNSYTLGIKTTTGQFNCFRCSIKGSWWDFKNLLNKNISINEFRNFNEEFLKEERMDDSEFFLYHQQLFDKEAYQQELEYLCGNKDQKQRHIKFETLVKYKVGIGKEEFTNSDGDYIKVPVIYFPMFKFEKTQKDSSDEDNEEESVKDSEENQRITISDNHHKLIKCKVRGIGPQNKRYMRIKPSGSKRQKISYVSNFQNLIKISGIFGINTIPLDAKEVVITEGEYDAMAVYQATGLPAISLPNGASNIPLEAIGCLDRFEKIYLWLDNDEVGRNNTKKLAEKLGINRTHIVVTEGEKDANDILRQDPSRIMKYIKQSSTVPDQNILQFSDLKESVYFRLLKFQNNQGIRSKRFEFFNQTIMGLRGGELTVLTGPTGSGKTTFLSQLSLDFCKQQVPTLWGSFEIKNDILATNMTLQMSGQDLYKQHQKFPYWAERFELLPMYYMNFFGSTNLEQILSTIEYSIYKYDIQHVIIDNLQFLLGTQAKGFSKFDLQDKSIESFRQLATKKEIHLTLVIHPKKVEENEDLNISSVFGSAKATQEADNLIIIQNRDKYRVIDIKKNRFNGEIGRKAIIFDKTNKNYYEMNINEVTDIISCKQTTSDIIKSKREKYLQQVEEEDLNISLSENKKNKKSGNDGGDGNNGGDSGSSSSSPSNSTQPQQNSTQSNQISSNNYQSNSQDDLQKKPFNNNIQNNQKQNNQNNTNNIQTHITDNNNNSSKESQEFKKKLDKQNFIEQSLDDLEATYKSMQATKKIEDSISINYNIEDDIDEAIQEELILSELKAQQHQSNKSSSKKYKPEEYNLDSLEPETFDLYKEDKEVKPKTTFFKNHTPIPPEERDQILSGNSPYKKQTSNNYKQYNRNEDKQELTKEQMDQLFDETPSIKNETVNTKDKTQHEIKDENKILSQRNFKDNGADLTDQLLDKKIAHQNKKHRKI